MGTYTQIHKCFEMFGVDGRRVILKVTLSSVEGSHLLMPSVCIFDIGVVCFYNMTGIRPIIINHHQSSSIIINDHQSSSIIINDLQSSSMIINHHQSSSMIINHHQSSSIIINDHQSSSIIINDLQPM